jgi:UDP-N-acetylmuramoyl-L-alanyl-D-glutamate--2,6-diaminopimelate ligase
MALPRELLKILKEAKGITQNSEEVREGFVFFALRGSRYDGHSFVEEASLRGARAVVVEREVASCRATVVKVEDTRKALGESADLFFGSPSRGVRVIGVTGTNGKTTVTYILEAILKEAGYTPGVVGTINYRLGERILGEGRTTPDPVLWHRTLRNMVDLGATHVVAEISSHALDQRRVWGTRFDTVVFTNLTQDHLDYHGDMENYFKAKLRLFTEYEHRTAVVNADDPYGKRILKEAEALTYGREGDVRIRAFRTGFEGSEITVSFRGKEYNFRSNLLGEFQAYNLACAIACAFAWGVDPGAVEKALGKVRVPGRFEVIESGRGFLVVVDYAHTPDAMDNVLGTIRKLTGGRVITVFGAGGDRDRTKRPLMGRSAERWSDIILLTSDNPRYEDPNRIIEDILKGIEVKKKVLVQPDRRTAIKVALDLAREGDVVAILGKGHEEFQEVRGVKYPFSDAKVVRELLSGGEDGL